jgi:hypothetical protein
VNCNYTKAHQIKMNHKHKLLIIIIIVFETRLCYVAQVGLNSWSSCLTPLSAGIVGTSHHAYNKYHFLIWRESIHFPNEISIVITDSLGLLVKTKSKKCLVLYLNVIYISQTFKLNVNFCFPFQILFHSSFVYFPQASFSFMTSEWRIHFSLWY